MPSSLQLRAESDWTSKLTAAKTYGNYTLDIGILRVRTLLLTAVMASVFTGVTLLFAGDGVQVSSFQSGDLDAAGQKQLLDKYNGWLGSLTALVMKPLDVALSMLIAVVFLCIATKWSVYYETRRRYLMMAVIGVVGYLMNTGFNSLNLQVVSGKIRPRIISSDLAVESIDDDTQKLDASGFLTTTMNSSFRENSPGNSVFNTILRNLFVATEEVPTWCNHTDDYVYLFKNTVATYGFPSRSWQQRALSKAREPTGSLSMPMNASKSELPSDEELPMNSSIATNLAVFDCDGRLPESASGNATFLGNLHEVIVNYFERTENASTTDELAKMEFSHVDLAENIAFDAFTIEIPTQKFGLQNDNSSSSIPFYNPLKAYSCNTKACIVSDVLKYAKLYDNTFETTVYPRVQALAICLNDAGGEDLVVDLSYYHSNQILQACTQRSATSMIIVSVGKRVEGDSFAAPDTEADDLWLTAKQLTNARMVYSLTDLSDVYGAECASDGGCYGVRFPLEQAANSSTNAMLLVSSTSIPMSSLSPINMNAVVYSVGSSQWKILASTLEEARGAALKTETRPAHVVLPRNFKTTDYSLTAFMEGEGLAVCERSVDTLLNHIEKNHLYIEHTLQPAYTAGLYFILQNAVVHEALQISDDPVEMSLGFSGNTLDMYVQASIPTTSMLIAFAGCIIMVLGTVVVFVLGTRGEQTLREHSSAAMAADILGNLEKFPPFLLRFELRESDTGEAAGALLDALHVESMVLVDKEDRSQPFAIGSEV
ncbi:hypothetical protein PHYSODRAFT_307445 [Phytophthora sojae]|uniref:Uncharacterized protein n=1 Tax=Phytophthora sojae (strain P6497) TaxID=1094619 RepID=G4YML4_PHYSP|nr:hypothetical protein PHYSODRAFT_294285 [Phytophthora sojae]XP_009538511.1 hypothetical protein PHYSODRAFT_307445 [Phytophthora sojae]EGZ05650.1 hypothetical protein PHYSODRAFT_307445 [Phytophthora sojae]EGZ28889.1 hypothetical protein PHYSODRAFT_294285 [Phytophthora sojae]|eukprot:XP_009516164.1 hypothetical protein PHYSODRAFT_294285 [Phytophthora sojae]